jgi:DNA-binding PadR family transcriptional regulator
VRGRIMFALVHDLKNQPSREKEIITTMAERGWNHIRQTVAPELSKLVKAGFLIRNDGDATYRLPGKLILSIDGKKIQ